MGYLLPTTTDWVTCSWQCHRDRNPPSGEPGTDYGADYGSPLYAVGNGSVTYVKQDNSGAMGRVVQYRLDDGRETRSLHLSEVWVGVGDRVARGQQIGRTGGSGHGSDHGYGSHVHQTLWPGAAWAADTIDFEQYQEDDMLDPNADYPAFRDMLYRALKWDVRDGDKGAGADASLGRTLWDRLGGIDNAIAADDPEPAPEPEPDPLRTPAWIAAASLAVLGISAAVAVGLAIIPT